MEAKYNVFPGKVLAGCLATACASGVAAGGLGHMVMIESGGGLTGSVTRDILVEWDGTLNTRDDINAGTLRENMTIESAGPTPFFGAPIAFHDVYVFGPGVYSFDVDCTPEQIRAGISDCPVSDTFRDSGGNIVLKPEGRTLQLTVGPGQLGAHLLFDWNNNNNIDVALLWEINGAFIASPVTNAEGTRGQVFDLTSADGNGDSIAGINMADGPFETQNLNFNLDIPPVSIGLDVKPKKNHKRLSQMSGEPVPVAIISRDTLDATRIDPDSLIASDPTGRIAGTTRAHLCRDRDVNQDGQLDLVCDFEMSKLSGPQGSRVFRVDTETPEGLPMRGEDSVVVVAQ